MTDIKEEYFVLNEDHGLYIQMVDGKLCLALEDLCSQDVISIITIPPKIFPKLRKFIKAPKRTSPK